jgi:hypothetical protein
VASKSSNQLQPVSFTQKMATVETLGRIEWGVRFYTIAVQVALVAAIVLAGLVQWGYLSPLTPLYALIGCVACCIVIKAIRSYQVWLAEKNGINFEVFLAVKQKPPPVSKQPDKQKTEPQKPV